MEGQGNKSNNKTSIEISRNVPTALIVGASGFIGSYLTEELLGKGIQVIGIDNLSSGKKEYLDKAFKNQQFHFLNISAERVNVDISRIDYIFISVNEKLNLDNILELAKEFKSKIVFISTIELYDTNHDSSLDWYKEAEGKVAKFATENHLNARVVRLSTLFGPRMHFKINDPMVRLIKASVLNDLAKENATSEFSTRALYVTDAVNLIIKSMLKGSTALKIFDGVGSPVKITEIKQILLDPNWHESRKFKPSDLPPWPSPNLERTYNELNWHPEIDLVSALKTTINYFNEHNAELSLEETKLKNTSYDEEVKEPEKLLMQQDLMPNKELEEKLKNWKEVINPQKEKNNKKADFSTLRRFLVLLICCLIILYGLFYPVGALIYGVVTFKVNLDSASLNLKKGNFNQSIADLSNAQQGINRVEGLIKAFEVLARMGLLKQQFELGGKLAETANNIIIGSIHATKGAQDVSMAIKKVSGEDGSTSILFENSSEEFALADFNFSKAKVDLDSVKYTKAPSFISNQVNILDNQVNYYSNLTKQIRALNMILPQAMIGDKSYLFVLGQESILRPGGGHIESVARVDLEKGKFKKIDSLSSRDIDNQQTLQVALPNEIKTLLNKNNYYLSDSNIEPDYPTNARLISWFYNKQFGKNPDGVIFWDISTLVSLLKVIGPITLDNYGEISAENLSDKALREPVNSLMLNQLQQELLNKLIYVPNLNLVGILSSLDQSSESKHMMIYMSNPKQLAFLISQNITGAFPVKKNNNNDFISLNETNLGGNKANSYIYRTMTLDSNLMNGTINDNLRINYTNKSLSNNYPEGTYKSLIKIYLPLGIKLSRVSFGEQDVKSQISTQVDYGRQVLSLTVNLNPKEQKTLSLEYQLPGNNFNGKGLHLDVIKQPGTSSNPFTWTLKGDFNQTIQADLSTNLSLQSTDY